VVDPLLDTPLQGKGFAGTEREDHDLARLENCLDAHGQGHLGYLV
jgi:hypothetical protein